MNIAIITAGVSALLVLLIIYVYKESTGFKVVNYDLVSPKIKKDIKIAFLSDLHNTEHGEKNCELMKAIDEINPDIIIFGGDMITSSLDTDYNFDGTLEFIKNLSEKHTVYYGIGNHESKFRDKSDKFVGKFDALTDFLNEINVPLLADCKICLDEYGIDLYCLDIGHKYYRKLITRQLPDDYIKSKLGSADKDRYSILIAHNPEHFEKYAAWGADLSLSGHVHGGVINVPYLGGLISPALKIFPKYDGGKFEKDGAVMIISRGIGSHTVPIRINNKAEIVVINIRK